jgi:His/Glu/Gln/Arg/opine family amino acid ABC transporter permease subunit
MLEGLVKVQQTFFDFEVIAQVLPHLILVGYPNTILLAIVASLIGIVLGMFIAIGLSSRNLSMRLPCRAYVDILRGLPHILTVYIVGQGLPIAGLALFGRNPYAYAAIAIGLIEAAYMAEIFRAGLQSVQKGQIEAARSLGMSARDTMRYIIVPQGVRRILPPLTSQFILVIKATSLVFLLGLTSQQRELFSIAQDAAINNANLSPLTAAGILYLLLTVPMTYAVNAWERRMGVSGRKAQGDV